MVDRLRLVAIIPAYNEAASIARVVEATLPFVDQVVVVDDGSHDDTVERAARAGAFVLKQKVNSGKGAALEVGFAYAVHGGYDAMVTLDADGQHDPTRIPDLCTPIAAGAADMSVGSRKREWARRMPVLRRVTNAMMSWLLSAVAGQPMEDTQSGFRCIGVRVARSVRVRARHFEAESEFLIRAARVGFRIAWVPIPAIYGADFRPSHIRPARDFVRFLRMMTRILLERNA